MGRRHSDESQLPLILQNLGEVEERETFIQNYHQDMLAGPAS